MLPPRQLHPVLYYMKHYSQKSGIHKNYKRTKPRFFLKRLCLVLHQTFLCELFQLYGMLSSPLPSDFHEIYIGGKKLGERCLHFVGLLASQSWLQELNKYIYVYCSTLRVHSKFTVPTFNHSEISDQSDRF